MGAAVTLAERWRWLCEAWRALRAAFAFNREILAAIPASAKPKGDIMSIISADELTALENLFKNGAPVAAAIGKAAAGPTVDDGFNVAEAIAGAIPLPQAQAAVMALKGLQFFVDQIIPLIKAGKIKGHSSGEGGIGANPAGNSTGV